MHETPSDEALLQSFTRGDREALGALALRYERALLGVAWGLMGDREEAREVVQDVWAKVVQHGRHFAGRSSVKTWLYRVCINRCLDLRRSRGRAAANGAAPRGEPSVWPERAVAEDEAVGRLRAAMQHLPPDKRLILLLSYHDGLSHTAAAEVLGIPVGTLKSRLHAALNELRSHLGEEVHP